MKGVNSSLFKSVLCMILTLVLIFPVSAYAIEGSSESSDNKDEDRRIVRVGWFTSDLFQEGSNDDEQKSGYSYNYLRKIADYASWEYEYVYGEWAELYQKLCDGEIDFMAGMSKTTERESLMLFPSTAMETDEYYLFKHSYDSTMSISKLSSFDGKKIGLLRNNRISDFAEAWVRKNNIGAQIVYYESFDSLHEDFEAGKIDLEPRTLTGASDYAGISAAVYLGEESSYLAVNKQRPDLLDELNDAINTMNSVEPYVLQELLYNTYGTVYKSRTITSDEKEWLEEHPVIKVGYIDDYLPYSATDKEGNATGIMTDVVSAALEALELESLPDLEYIAYDTYQQIVSALNSDEIDLAFPVPNNTWELEQDGISASSDVISDRGAFFYKTVCEKEKVKKIAVKDGNSLQLEYTMLTYPEAKIVYYSTIDECLDAVLNGDVDATIMDSLRVHYVTGKSKYDSLSYVLLSETTGKCFGIKHGNKNLLMLINRGLKILGTSYGYDRSYKYIESFGSYSTLDFIREHKFEIALTLFLITIVIITLLILHIRKQKKEIIIREDLKRKAEDANKAKSMFLFNMSHDIRTPMNAVLGFNELMLKELNNPDKLNDYIDKIKISGEYLLSLINNVLEVARIDSGREALDESFTDLMDESYYVIFENDVRKKNLNIIRNIDVQHRYVYTDSQKIREILLNIISNAIKYTLEGGTISIDFMEEPCDKEGYATYICRISDTGIGMTREFQEHIFDTFSRERNSTESRVMGTGLGMTIVKKLTELLGGTVTVDSDLGKGSTFTVTIDMRIVDNPEEFLKKGQEAEPVTKLNLEGKRVLVAEDNELNAEIITAILEGLGAAVDVAADGVICVDMMQNHEAGYYSVVLMDVQMPNLDGYGATKKIRAFSDKAKASIPIAAMTANAFDEDIKSAFEAGMDGHIAKPIDVNKLASTLARLLTKKN